jgi:glycosyltransferase involved in cell wall biosynthesis
MRVGIDIQHLRLHRRGIYYYIWNVLEQMDRQDHPHQLVLYLYGQRWMDDPNEVQRWAEAFPTIDREYYWDMPPLRLLSHRLGVTPAQAPWLARMIDRKLLWPLWQKMAATTSGPRLWQCATESVAVDVFHHTAGLLFPIEGHANVLTIYDLIPFRSPEYNPDAAVMFGDGFTYANRMDLIITISEFTKQDVVNSLGVDEAMVRAIPLAIDEQFRYWENRDEVRQVLAKYDMHRRPYVIHLGSIEARKNLLRLLEAFKRLKQAADAPPHELVLAGADGGNLKEVKGQIEKLGLEGDARCLGFVTRQDLPAMLNGADLFIYPSLYEGFGLPGIEAMACGTPVAAANATSLPEVVGDAGLLFDPLDADEMTAIMRRILSDSNLRDSMRMAGRARAAEFSWRRTARETLDAYQQASENFRCNGRHARGKVLQTRFRQMMRHLTWAQTPTYIWEGARIQNWV